MTISLSVDVSNIVDGQQIDAADVTTPINNLKTALEDTLNGVQQFGLLAFGTPESLTINAGAITITQSHVVVDTQASAATDDLDTINGGGNGKLLFIRTNNSARDVVLKHGTGNIATSDGADVLLGSVAKFALLFYTNSNWLVLAGAGGGGVLEVQVFS